MTFYSCNVSDVYDFYTQRFREHLLILEQKTGKQNYIALNKNAKNALRWYMDACFPQECDYLFCKNTDRQHPINRSQAYRIVKEAAAQTTNSRMVSCHSMRKTFGYHAWKQGHSLHCLWVCSITLPMMSPNAILELSRMKRILSI
ncbi:MAG: tyrosine-type recombinase/integrase [Roseburia faecis]